MDLNRRKLIIVSVSGFDEVNFFVRFIHAAKQMGYRMVYITYEFSMYRALQKTCGGNVDIYFLKRRKDSSESDRHEDIEVLIHKISYDTAESLYTAAMWLLLNHFDPRDIAQIWCWNGMKTVDHALTDYAEKNKIPTLFMELANIPGKIFVDPWGTNCRSLLYADKHILDSSEVDQLVYETWRDSYISDKLKEKTIKQASTKPSFFNSVWKHLYDKWGYIVHHGAFWQRNSVIAAVHRLYKIHYTFRNLDFTKFDYAFFPLQVSTDTQILINGNVSLMEAVEKVLKFAMEKGIYLVIKPHPAEKNPIYFDDLKKKLSVYDKVIFTNENTFVLLQNAKYVFTINSTVGLEAMILGRKPYVFGKALYENFTPDDIPRYIMGYLFDIDFWGTGDIPVEMFKKVLERAELCAK